MSKYSNSTSMANRLIGLLPSADVKKLIAGCERVDLPRRTRLELSQKRIEYVYFLETGVISVVATGSTSGEVEVGIIGNEGMSGLALLHGTDRSPYASYMQVAGTGLRADADLVRNLVGRSGRCSQIFLNFAQSFLLQVAETSVAKTRATTNEALARWLLMLHDRMEDDTIPLTHEFLSIMMGIRRSGITEAIHALAKKSLISHTRGKIVIENRFALEAYAGGYYGLPEKELLRLQG